jgi:hypothetical protein
MCMCMCVCVCVCGCVCVCVCVCVCMHTQTHTPSAHSTANVQAVCNEHPSPQRTHILRHSAHTSFATAGPNGRLVQNVHMLLFLRRKSEKQNHYQLNVQGMHLLIDRVKLY